MGRNRKIQRRCSSFLWQVIGAFQSLLLAQCEALVRERGCGSELLNAAGAFFLRYLASLSTYRFLLDRRCMFAMMTLRSASVRICVRMCARACINTYVRTHVSVSSGYVNGCVWMPMLCVCRYIQIDTRKDELSVR
jgi:hypothetical protein